MSASSEPRKNGIDLVSLQITLFSLDNIQGCMLRVYKQQENGNIWSDDVISQSIEKSNNLEAICKLKVPSSLVNEGHFIVEIMHGDRWIAGGMPVQCKTRNAKVWLHADVFDVYLEEQDAMHARRTIDLHQAWAHWASADVIQWRLPPVCMHLPDLKYYLVQALGGESRPSRLHVTGDQIEGWQYKVPLSVSGDVGARNEVIRKFPHLSYGTSFYLPDISTATKANPNLPDASPRTLLTGQLAVIALSQNDHLVYATEIQTAGAIDDLCVFPGPLGAHRVQIPVDPPPDGSTGTTRTGWRMSLWAPTATCVRLYWWPDADTSAPGNEIVVDGGGTTGWPVYSVDGGEEWTGRRYQWHVRVYHTMTRLQTWSTVADPYAVALTANGVHAIVADVDDPELMPSGWKDDVAPAATPWQDISVYELHVRDFSATDWTVPIELRGKFGAFSEEVVREVSKKASFAVASEPELPTAGQQHLKRVSQAGITHLHLLPVYDFGSVPEDENDVMTLQEGLTQYGPDGKQQQQAVMKIAGQDAFNWGYDPVYYGTPDGSYCMDPNSPTRIKDFRHLVMAVHKLDLRLVIDVVYNHTFAAGPSSPYSVLDKVVPGYYHRRSENGVLCGSFCGADVAGEHVMAQHLIKHDVLHWCKTYHVDGIRFDIMGALPKSLIVELRRMVDVEFKRERGDYVDGQDVYMYGEAWDSGEVIGNARFITASQYNLTGCNVGMFNDRLRESVMGGSPFEDSQMQGLVTGLAFYPNPLLTVKQGSVESQISKLRTYQSCVMSSLVACLTSFPFPNHPSNLHNTQHPIAFTAQPWEAINYVSCHDNFTLFDMAVLKPPATMGLAPRIRMVMQSMAFVACAQGVAFFHAGDELLRSKSLDRDSYDSGDWFNAIDWQGQKSTFGVGLPVASKNEETWAVKGPLLRRADLMPRPGDIAKCQAYFEELMQLRYSTPLFRLPSANRIVKHVEFFNNIMDDSELGIIIMHISSPEPHEEGYDEKYTDILVVFNTTPKDITKKFPKVRSGAYYLHPILSQSADEKSRRCATDGFGSVFVPARCTGVFVRPREQE